MTFVTVKIPKGCHVLLLEDSKMRIEWFKKRIPLLHVCKSVQEFKDYFDTHPTVDFIFFDHDLGPGGDGVDAAKFMVDRFGSGNRWGFIHSWNVAGVSRLKEILPNVAAAKFGDFEVEAEE